MPNSIRPPSKSPDCYVGALAKRLLWVGLLSLLTGCAFVRGEVGQTFTEPLMQDIKRGTTTRQEVAQQFGAPDEVVQANGFDIFHYRHFDSKFGWLLFFSRLNVGSDNLWIFFNSEGIVQDVVYGNRTDQLEFQVWPFGE